MSLRSPITARFASAFGTCKSMIDGVIRCCITETVELKRVAVQQGVGDPCIKRNSQRVLMVLAKWLVNSSPRENHMAMICQ
jgi:hypothetical protein